jgi:hypothetical protein
MYYIGYYAAALLASLGMDWDDRPPLGERGWTLPVNEAPKYLALCAFLSLALALVLLWVVVDAYKHRRLRWWGFHQTLAGLLHMVTSPLLWPFRRLRSLRNRSASR